jgi:hypothetical protein
MSRPFSYNDENFTVIGNILFCHIKLNKDLNDNDNIIEIPPALYYRICQKTIMFNFLRQRGSEDIDSYTRVTYISEENGKYYIKIFHGTVGTFFITSYVILKDI